MGGPRDWEAYEPRRPGMIRRVLPTLLAFAVISGGLVYLGDDLRELLGTAPGSPRSVAAKHRLYEETGPIDARCGTLPRNLDADARASLKALSGCLDRMWAVTLAKAGIDYAAPEEVRLIAASEEAACGIDDYDWAGVYCPDSHVVNVLVEDERVFPMMFTLAHEYAHHVQEVSGIADQGGSEAFDEAWSRRLELQADCLAAATLRIAAPRRLKSLRGFAGRDSGAEDDTEAAYRQSHGSGASRAEWMRHGQEGGTVAACNTWGAPAEQVS
ncbi:neutral zinc metallopeptidase [Streptosporangium sp. NBC_01755]|uniref:neutral zinc metallopeptidase n=1 Tax=unclassified Streptosporangium TaxID=2632669 RepID=UPI002DD7CB09|nr:MULTISPECIES: neutral zinc metallopeptidase [unclassified Streptosporangium]WSA23941.1 neutral zinc metallopeptidase [Streptosporangium sp. NBC_01810]WSC97984.1 neutral zinc metallopeptidase [Streptosporangium sp. NBC_01755]